EEEAVMASKASDDDICVTSVLDKGKGLADNGKGLVDRCKGIMVDEGKAGRKTARSRNIGNVIGENVNLTFSEDDDFDNSESEYSDKSIYYLSEVAGCSKPNRMYDVGESDTVIEYKEYMEKLMHQLRDKGDVLTDPIIILENDQSNKKLVKSKFARCRMRPKKLKDSEKGKQIKHFKYPSVGRNEGSNFPFRCYGKLMLTESSF
ncbi:hypothetical protein Tco_0929817, partial [Tanacetum coccineum]